MVTLRDMPAIQCTNTSNYSCRYVCSEEISVDKVVRLTKVRCKLKLRDILSRYVEIVGQKCFIVIEEGAPSDCDHCLDSMLYVLWSTYFRGSKHSVLPRHCSRKSSLGGCVPRIRIICLLGTLCSPPSTIKFIAMTISEPPYNFNRLYYNKCKESYHIGRSSLLRSICSVRYWFSRMSSSF